MGFMGRLQLAASTQRIIQSLITSHENDFENLRVESISSISSPINVSTVSLRDSASLIVGTRVEKE